VYQRDDLIDPMRTNAKGETSLSLMQRGRAPIGPDGQPVQLHHTIQVEPGAVAEVPQSFHQAYGRELHINPSNTIPSGVDRNAFKQWKSAYWSQRASDFG
jgi:filamentous hemagglutinin